jgi:UPF0755 protein
VATQARRKPQPRKKKGTARRARQILLGLAVLAVLAAVPAALVAHSWWKLNRRFQGYPGTERVITVEHGQGVAQILALLEHEGVIADAKLARSYLVYVLKDPALQAGEYRFEGPLSTPEVLEKLIKGQVVTEKVTVIEGRTLEETAEILANAGFGNERRLLALLRSPELIADLDPEAQDLEGYLYPETYNFARGTAEHQIVETLVRTFRGRFERDVLPLLLKRQDARTLRQVVTLASIVEKEAQVGSERPLIAAVYANRLEQGIGLMADPTVIYALKRLGKWNGNLRRDDLRLDSPYNTYRYAGLPPGPIASPGLASLKAAAEPADVTYLYFVSRNDGTHAFADTLDEHNDNVEQWQRRYWRERRKQGKR